MYGRPRKVKTKEPARGRPGQRESVSPRRPSPMRINQQSLQRRYGAVQIVVQPRRGRDGPSAISRTIAPRTSDPKTLIGGVRPPPVATTGRGASTPTIESAARPRVGAEGIPIAGEPISSPASGDAAGRPLAYPAAPEAALNAADTTTDATKRVKRHRPVRDPHALGPNDLMTVPEMCSYLHISEKTCRNWACRGYGPRRIRISARCIRIRKGDVDDWLAARRVYSTSEAIGDA